ncbi:MAG: YbjQ family protein [Ruminococcus sp.]|nr:YbjQ family protein [Ruminococcus sp.]
MLITTTEFISGKTYSTLGLVRGSTIQSKHIGSDISQGFKTIVGGELKSYTDMLNKARDIATQRMIEQATAIGADAIVSVRFATSSVMNGAAEVMAYGTAVKLN